MDTELEVTLTPREAALARAMVFHRHLKRMAHLGWIGHHRVDQHQWELNMLEDQLWYSEENR